jgi:hypothetical protein
MPLTYRQTKDIYDTLKDAGATTLSLPDWSRQMAATTESDTFDAGLKDNWLKRLNTSIDRGIEWTGLPELTGEMGAGIGSAFGMEDVGRSAGESIPRMAADMATFFIPGLGASTAAARLLPAMGMAGMGAYTETGSPAAGVASAALMGVLPGATDMAEQWALKRLGAKKMAGDILVKSGTNLMDSGVTQGFSRYMPQNLAQGAGAYTVGQAAAMGLMGGSTVAQQAFAGEEISNPFTGEFWLSQGIQNLPFMALHGAKKLAGPSYGKAIEATGQALLEGHDALAWKQLQRDNWTYYPKEGEGKAKGPLAPLTPKAQEMLDRLQGKPPTEEEYTAARGWLTELEDARRRVEQEPTDEEAQKNLRIVNSNLVAAIELGDIPFSAFVNSPDAVEVKGEITGISKSGKQVTAWVDTPEGRQKVQFSRGTRTGAHEIGQTVFKMPVDPTYVTWNPEKSEAWKAKEAADAAQADAKRAQDDLKGKIDLHVEAHMPDELVAKAKGFVGEAEFAARVDEAAKRNALLRKNAKGEVVATADSRAGDELDAAKRIVAQHDTAFVADRASAEELARKSEGLTKEAFRLEREAREQKLQEVAQLVAQFNSLPMTTADEKQSKRGVAMRIEGLLTGAGLPSMFDRKAKRWGPLAGVTAHNLGLALDEKGVLWLKGMLDELRASNSEIKEKPRKNKKVSLDAAAEQGDSLMAEVVGSQREFDEQLNTSEEQHEMGTILEASGTKDPIVVSLHGDLLVKTLQQNVGELQDVFDSWNKDEAIDFRDELVRMHAYVDAKLAAGEEFNAKEFWDSQNVDLVESGGDLSTFEQRPHTLTLMKRFTEQLKRPGTPLVAKAKARAERYSAGGDFIWGVNPEVATPKHAPGGKVDEAWFQRNAGLGGDKTVSPVEMGLMKALDEATKSGVFVNGKVDMSKLKSMLSDPEKQPVTNVTYGMKGKADALIEEQHKLMGELDASHSNLEATLRTAQQVGGRGLENLPKRLEHLRQQGWSEEDLNKITRLTELKSQTASLPPDTSPRATSYYEAISAVDNNLKWTFNGQEFDSQPFRVDVLFKGYKGPSDPLHTPAGSETGGWGMFQFVPGKLVKGWKGHPDEPVMLLEEEQSLAEQQRQKAIRAFNVKQEGEKWTISKENTKSTFPSFKTKPEADAYVEKMVSSVPSHPLLRLQHVLVLKAAIAEARKRGVTEMVVSDGETAMMTERLDKRIKQFRDDIEKSNAYPRERQQVEKEWQAGRLTQEEYNTRLQDTPEQSIKRLAESINSRYADAGGKVEVRDGQIVVTKEPYVAGFSVAYDTTLQSAMRSLTGDKGEKWEGPVHKNARDPGPSSSLERLPFVATNEQTGELHYFRTLEEATRYSETAGERMQGSGADGFQNPWTAGPNPEAARIGQVVGSPVFRNPDGTPKSSVTGTIYNLSNAFAKLEANEGFTLSRPSHAKKKWVPTPEGIQVIADRKLNEGGRAIAEVISAMEDADPADRAMAELLIRNLPETLSRVEAEFDAKGETEYAPMIRQRKGKITFAPWNLGESDNSWAGTAMEELQHHVGTIALRDPKNKEAFDGFENLRKRVIAGLSKEKGGELDAFNYLVKLYKKDPNRYIKQGDVHKDSRIEDLVYALQNVDEFYANGNRAHALRERLKLMEPTKHWLSEFVDNVKKLFGIGPKETAFDEFLYHTKQVMDSSEAVAKSFNYLEAHFAQRGYDPNRANDATQVAMRLMNKHGVDKGNPQELFAILAKPSDMDSNELVKARNKFKRLMASPDSKEMGNTALLFSDPNTGKAIENWFMEQLDTPSSVVYFNHMPDSVQRYLSLRVQQMQDVLLGIHNLAKNGSGPVTDLLSPKTLERTAKDMLEKVQPFVRQQDVVMTSKSQMRALDSFGTENMLEVMSRPLTVKAKVKGETPDGFIDEKIGFLRKLTLQIGQWAQSNPLVKELLVRMTGSDTLARKFAQSAQHDVLGYDPANPGVYNEKIAEGWREWLEKGQNKDIVDTIMRVNNVIGKDKVELLKADHPAMLAAGVGVKGTDQGPHGGFTEREKLILKARQLVAQMAIGTQKGQTHILHRMGENGTLQGAKLVLLQEKDLNVEAAMTASRNVLDALMALKENPADVMAGQKLQQAQAVLQPKTLEQLMEAQDRMSKVLIAAKLHFKNNPGWVTAQRKGDFIYKGFRGKEEIIMGADSDKEVLARARKHGVKIDLTTKKPNEPGDYATMDWSQDFIDKAKAYDEHQQLAAKAAGASDEVLSAIQKLAPGAQILKDQHVSYDIGAGESKGRTLSKGGDIVPFTDHFFSWLEGSPAYWNKRLIREQVEMTLLAPEYRAAPETSQGLRQWLNGFLTPDPKPMRALQKAVTTFTLGGNVGFLLNNVFQPFLRGIPEMMSHGVGFWSAFRGVSGALKDAAKSFTKLGGMTDLSKGLPDANERWFMERLNNDLITDRSLFDETEMRKGYDSYKLTASLNASKPKTFGQWVASVGGAYSNVALSMVRHGERANTEATALGAFRALMRTFPEKGREWAEGKARDVHQATNDPGGRFNRAIGLYDNAGPASRSAAMMAGALQSYTFGTINQILRNFQRGWRNSSLTPAEKYAGRKAFLTQLGLQFAVAGALGMPFVSGALALINQVDPSLEINKNVRGLMQQFFAEDGKDGHLLTDMMMSGLPSQLGWDMQSRLSSGELIPGVSERDGFQISNLFGVPASLATQMAEGVKQIMNGQGAGLMAFVPPGLRSQIRLATGTAGEDNKGRAVLNDMTPGEGLGLALGMRPTRLRQFNDAQRMEKQAEEQDAIRKGRWRQKAAQQVLKGEFGSVMGELKSQLAENPKLDVAGEVRQIAKYAEDQAFPRDLRREAKGDNRSELLRMWNLAPSMPTEEQRLQFRMKVEQQFGVRGDSGKALVNARMMDELRKQRPDATRAELRAMLPRAQRPQPMLAE